MVGVDVGRAGGAGRTEAHIAELDGRRRARNAFALAVGLSGVSGALALAMLLASVDARVVCVTVAASVAFGGCAFVGRKGESAVTAPLLNALLFAVLFAGVAVNRQIGPGPAFVGFSLFAAAATLTIRGVILGGIVGASSIVGMALVSWNEPQLAVRPPTAMVYGLSLCVVTTILSVVQARNTRRALVQVVERERRALAAEARAQESEARYRLTTDNMSDLIALLDRGGRCLYASPSFERILGVSPDDLLRESRRDLMHPDDTSLAASHFAVALARGKARGTYRIRDTSDHEHWIEALYDAVPSGDRTLVVVAARDVTENRALTAQLQQAQKMDALGRMAAAVAHDFNNLLTVIRSAITVALWEFGESDTTTRSALLHAEQATIGAAALTARLLAFSRRAVVALEVVDARKALSGLTELLPRALGSGIDLDVRLDADLPPIVAAPVQLEQILLNLAINARDAMPDGGTLSVVARSRQLAEGEESDCRPGEWLELDVKDTGSGLTEDAKAHLFEPFFTTKPPGEGTGLGLSTCYGIVRQLGGSIRAASAPGQGTTFTVLLPRALGSLDAPSPG
jgi:PAS domain S-box-containing protein